MSPIRSLLRLWTAAFVALTIGKKINKFRPFDLFHCSGDWPVTGLYAVPIRIQILLPK